MKLEFIQENNNHGSCACYLNGKLIDHCDMNKELAYTQAHLVYARVKKTYPEEDLKIEVVPALNGPGVYSIEDIISMGTLLMCNEIKPYHK